MILPRMHANLWRMRDAVMRDAEGVKPKLEVEIAAPVPPKLALGAEDERACDGDGRTNERRNRDRCRG
jgi:hypothetical protein